MNDYPRMLYRKGAETDPEIFGLRCETMLVDSAEEEQAAKADGYFRSPHEAHGLEPPRSEDEDATRDPDDLAAKQAREEALRAAEDERNGLLQEIEDLRVKLKVEQSAREAAEKERDESRELIAAFDKDGDGKPGGSKPKLSIKTTEKA